MRGIFCGLVAVVFAGVVWGLEAPVYIRGGIWDVARKNYNEQLAAQGLALPTDYVGLPPNDAAAAAGTLTQEERRLLSGELVAYKRGTWTHTPATKNKPAKEIPVKWVADCACLKQHNKLIGEIIALELSETQENLAASQAAIVEKYGAARANYEGHKTTCPQRNKIIWTAKYNKH
jgi:hypothetical protein